MKQNKRLEHEPRGGKGKGMGPDDAAEVGSKQIRSCPKPYSSRT